MMDINIGDYIEGYELVNDSTNGISEVRKTRMIVHCISRDDYKIRYRGQIDDELKGARGGCIDSSLGEIRVIKDEKPFKTKWWENNTVIDNEEDTNSQKEQEFKLEGTAIAEIKDSLKRMMSAQEIEETNNRNTEIIIEDGVEVEVEIEVETEEATSDDIEETVEIEEFTDEEVEEVNNNTSEVEVKTEEVEVKTEEVEVKTDTATSEAELKKLEESANLLSEVIKKNDAFREELRVISTKIDEIAKELDRKDRNWRAFDLVRHFKGDKYRVISLGVDTETEKDVVIYKREDGTGNIWVRPLEMFNSKVDKEKYPDCIQEYRFELIERIGV